MKMHVIMKKKWNHSTIFKGHGPERKREKMVLTFNVVIFLND